jgi:hypothetical protein
MEKKTAERNPNQLPSEKYDVIFHYTTVDGLLGILKDGVLRATHYRYLNDAKEIVGFLDEELPNLFRAPVLEQLTKIYGQDNGKTNEIKKRGGVESCCTQIVEELIKSAKESFERINEPFITAFCGSHSDQVKKSGLLSQWRGYGSDGGYAIAFRTEEIEKLLKQEFNNHLYMLAFLNDVHYQGSTNKENEVINWELDIIECTKKYVANGSPSILSDTYIPITALACLTKHHGFHEERELRIVAVPAANQNMEILRQHGNHKPSPQIDFRTRNGMMIPFLSLFKGSGPLPIESIIVGPSHDCEKRRKSVEILLAQLGVKADVRCSDIPFVGR